MNGGGGVEVVGLAEFHRAIEALPERVELANRLAVTEGAHLLEREVKTNLSRYSHPKGTATPSPPGEPPALVTGTLRRSIAVKGPVRIGFGAYEALVGPTVIYGRVQELGGETRYGYSLPARPYVEPGLHRLLDSGELAAVFRHAWARALR